MPKGKVSVGFLHPGKVSTCFMYSMRELSFYDAMMYQRFQHPQGEMGKLCGSGGIPDGRNEIAKAMLDQSEAEWLFMVDSDMDFQPDIVERLIDAAHAIERPVVGALAFAHKTNGPASGYGLRYRCIPTLYDWYEDDNDAGFISRENYERDTLTQVAATGSACILIHRLALEAVREKYGDVWYDPIRHPKRPTPFSEDLSFCIRVAACGIQPYVHTGIKTGHDKGGVFYDEAFFDEQQQRRAHAEAS